MTTTISSPPTTMNNSSLSRGGILLNSPSSSPRNSIFLSPHSAAPQRMSMGSQSSSTSSSSSTDDVTSSSEGNMSSSTNRKIRFAPLPDPRRAVLVTEEGREVPLLTSTRNEVSRSKQFPPTPIPVIAAPNSLPISSYFDHHHAAGISLEDLDSGQNTETNTITGTDDGGSTFSLPLNAKRERKWNSRGLLKPLFKVSKVTSVKNSLTTEEVLTLGAINLFRSSSRESVGSAYTYRENNSGAPLRRHLSQPAEGDEKRAVRGGRAPTMSETGTSSTSAVKGTRLLNGRVYGRRMSEGLRGSDEPEFLEWGQGGMGSVIGGAGHVKSSNDDEDDGSGMGWVKRRRAQREKEAKERAEVLSHKDGVGGCEDEKQVIDVPEDNQMHQITEVQSAPPTIRVHRVDSTEHHDSGDKFADGKDVLTALVASAPAVGTPRSEDEHETAVVSIPVTHGHHHHHLSHHRAESPVNTLTPPAELNYVSSPLKSETGSETGSTSSSSNMDEEDDDDDDEGTEKDPKEAEETPDSDEDEEVEDEEAEELRRKTAMSAGVEKISRHKE